MLLDDLRSVKVQQVLLFLFELELFESGLENPFKLIYTRVKRIVYVSITNSNKSAAAMLYVQSTILDIRRHPKFSDQMLLHDY